MNLSPPVPSDAAPALAVGADAEVVALDARPRAIEARSVDAARRLRAFDLVVTLLLLPFAVVAGALIAVLIVLDSPGPVIYRATRVGKGGRTFTMLKFRKMRRHATGMPLTMADDERFTPIGRFLAVTKLDELPQLWNVLRGDMRLVGPRPEDVSFVSRYEDAYREILTVVPGITGPAAVEYARESFLLAGHEDPVTYYAEHLMPLKIEIDLEYTRNHSIGRDCRLLLATFTVPVIRLVRGLGGRSREARHHSTVAMLGASCTLVLLFALCVGP